MITPASLASSLPPLVPGYAGKALTALQVLAILTAYGNEADAATRTPYSKFAGAETGKQAKEAAWMVSSRAGMMVIYAPSLAVNCFVLLGSSSNVPLPILPGPTPAAALCAVHFAKRCLEVNFLHRYSGSVALRVSSFIGAYYALISYLICSVASVAPSRRGLAVGTCLFAIGLVGNLYHHNLLADLRRRAASGAKLNGKIRRYQAPRGGLFGLVAAPHYLFELLGWLGVACVADHGNAYLVFLSMGSYLGGRARAQHEWNRSKFPEEWGKNSRIGWGRRRDLVPFLL